MSVQTERLSNSSGEAPVCASPKHPELSSALDGSTAVWGLRASFANKDLGCQAGANASRCPRQPAQHDAAHGAVDHSLSRLWQTFVVLAQTSRQSKPSEGALYDPTAR